MFIIDIDRENPPRFHADKLEEKLQKAGRLWRDRLTEALTNLQYDETKTATIVEKYGQVFPVSYRETFTAKQAIYDIEKMERAAETNDITLDLYQCKNCESQQLRLKVFHPDKPVRLSDILPILENIGLSIESELPFEIKAARGKQTVWIHDFMMEIEKTQTAPTIDNVKRKFRNSPDSDMEWQNRR